MFIVSLKGLIDNKKNKKKVGRDDVSRKIGWVILDSIRVFLVVILSLIGFIGLYFSIAILASGSIMAGIASLLPTIIIFGIAVFLSRR